MDKKFFSVSVTCPNCKSIFARDMAANFETAVNFALNAKCGCGKMAEKGKVEIICIYFSKERWRWTGTQTECAELVEPTHEMVVRLYSLPHDAAWGPDDENPERESYEADIATTISLQEAYILEQMLKNWERWERKNYSRLSHRQYYYSRRRWRLIKEFFRKGNLLPPNRFDNPEHIRIQIVQEDEGWACFTFFPFIASKEREYETIETPAIVWDEKFKSYVFAGRPMWDRENE